MTSPQVAPHPAGTEAPGNLAAQFVELAELRGWSGRAAFHQGHRSWTHGEVHDLAARAATVLAGHGVRPGDRVLLALPNSHAWVTAFLATARLGAVAVPVNPELPAADHAFLAEDTGAVLCVTGLGLEERFAGRARLGADQLMALAPAAMPAPAHQVDARTLPWLPVLPDVTAGLVQEWALRSGIRVAHRERTVAGLGGREVWLTNALHGIRPVTEWIRRPMRVPPVERAGEWRAWLDGRMEPLPES